MTTWRMESFVPVESILGSYRPDGAVTFCIATSFRSTFCSPPCSPHQQSWLVVRNEEGIGLSEATRLLMSFVSEESVCCGCCFVQHWASREAGVDWIADAGQALASLAGLLGGSWFYQLLIAFPLSHLFFPSVP